MEWLLGVLIGLVIALLVAIGFCLYEEWEIERFLKELEDDAHSYGVPLSPAVLDKMLYESRFITLLDETYMDWFDDFCLRLTAVERELADHRAFIDAMEDMDVLLPVGDAGCGGCKAKCRELGACE